MAADTVRRSILLVHFSQSGQTRAVADALTAPPLALAFLAVPGQFSGDGGAVTRHLAALVLCHVL